jgi:hypothetical membrane protein
MDPPWHPAPISQPSLLVRGDRGRRLLSGALLLAGPAAFVLGMVVAVLHYGPPPYRFVSNSISDLQAVHCGSFDGQYVCSPAHQAANAGVFLAGSCLIFGALLGWPTITDGGRYSRPAALLVLAGVAAAANAFTPEDVTLIGDAVTAFIIFLASDVGLILLGRSSSSARGPPRFFAYPAVLGEFGLFVLTLWSLGLEGPLGAGVEWLVVAPILVWMLVAGVRMAAGRGRV